MLGRSVQHALDGIVRIQTMATKTVTERLMDSAVIIAITTGLCYVAGLIAHTRMRAMRLPGIPSHLLPETPLNQTLVLGGVYVLLYIATGLFIYLLYVWISKSIVSLRCISEYSQHRLEHHPLGFSLFLGLIASTAFLLMPLYLRLPLYIFDTGLLKVVELKISHQQPITSQDNWKYVCRKDGIIVFSLPSERRYILIKDGDLERLTLENSENLSLPSN